MVARLSGGDSAVTTLNELGDRMVAAGASASSLENAVKQAEAALEQSAAAASAAADAVSAGAAAYSQAEAAVDRLAMQEERLGQKAVDLAAAMQLAMDAGDATAFWTMAGAANALEQKQAELAEKSAAATAALQAEGAALDALRAKSAAAKAQQDALGKGLENLKKSAGEASKAEQAAAKAAAGSGKVNEMSEALGRLGGPAGRAGQQVFGFIDGLKKLVSAAGSAGPIIALAVVVAALAIGFAAATVAVTKWGIELADAKRSASDVLKLDNQFKRFQKLIDETFGGLKTDALMRGLQVLINLFDSSTASGRAMKAVFEAAFQPIVDFLANHAADIERFFLGIVIGALKVAIALKPLKKAFSEVLDFLGSSGIDPKTLGVAFAYIAVAAGVLAAVIGGVLVVALGTLFAILSLPVAAVMAFWALLTAFASWLSSAWDDPVGAVMNLSSSFAAAGSALVDGFISGITAGIGRAVAAVEGLGSAAMGALKGALGIHSPSAVFAEFGGMTAEGFAQGVEGSGRPTSAVESMVATPAVGGAGGGRGGVNVTIEQMIVQGENAKEVAEDFEAQLMRVLEGDLLGAGA
jgi:hypothetical protein